MKVIIITTTVFTGFTGTLKFEKRSLVPKYNDIREFYKL